MNIKKGIYRMMLEQDKKQSDLGALLNKSSQNVSAYLRRDDLRIYNDICRIADALGYDVRLQFVDRKNGKVIDCDD